MLSTTAADTVARVILISLHFLSRALIKLDLKSYTSSKNPRLEHSFQGKDSFVLMFSSENWLKILDIKIHHFRAKVTMFLPSLILELHCRQPPVELNNLKAAVCFCWNSGLTPMAWKWTTCVPYNSIRVWLQFPRGHHWMDGIIRNYSNSEEGSILVKFHILNLQQPHSWWTCNQH